VCVQLWNFDGISAAGALTFDLCT